MIVKNYGALPTNDTHDTNVRHRSTRKPLGNHRTLIGVNQVGSKGFFWFFGRNPVEDNPLKINTGRIYLVLVDLMSPSTKTSKIRLFGLSTMYLTYIMYWNIRNNQLTMYNRYMVSWLLCISLGTTVRYCRFEPTNCTIRTYGTVLPGVRLNLNGFKSAWTQHFFFIFFLDSSLGQPTEDKSR